MRIQVSYPPKGVICMLRKPTPALFTRTSLACLGLFPLISFSTSFSLLVGDVSVYGVSFVMLLLPTMVKGAVFLTCALLITRIKGLLERKSALGGFAAAAVCGGILHLLVMILPASGWAAILSVAGTSLAGLGYALLYLAWMELYAQLITRHVIAFMAVAHLLSALCTYALYHWVIQPVSLLSALALPVISVALLVLADKETLGSELRLGESVHGSWRISVRPLALLAVFAFANETIRGFLGTDERAFVLIGVAGASLAVLAVWLFHGGSRFFRCLCRCWWRFL